MTNPDIAEIERIDDEMQAVHFTLIVTSGNVRFEVDQSFDFTTMNTPNDIKPVWNKLVSGRACLVPRFVGECLRHPEDRTMDYDGLRITGDLPMALVLSHLVLCSVQKGRWWGWLNG
jgi:hypothetical protein